MQKDQDVEIDWDAMNEVADWVVTLESGKLDAPDALIQSAIAAGKRYLTEPTIENKSGVDKLATQLADMERDSFDDRETGRDD
ncbi:MAG: hypothetical protein CUN55_15745 [Phototrophicales bacterium]|nr:MAG: hypothetical protein CUN55_15745 [Phototrophicales bacterium]